MKWPALALVCVASTAGCEQDPARVQARGAGVSSALEVLSAAANLAAQTADRPASRCRAVSLPDGPVTVDARITLALKHAASRAGTQHYVVQWRRDAAQNVAFRRELVGQLPDGRPLRRVTETRRVGGRHYRALDDRFVDAERVPGIAAELDAAAFSDIDGLLSLIDREQATWRAALPGEGICRGQGALGLPSPQSAELVWAADGRSGDIHWALDGTTLIAEFSETITAGAIAVEAPGELMAIEPDPTWPALRSFVEQGQREGWMLPGRTFGDWTAMGGSGAAP